jgi:cysteine synthase A
MSKDQMINATSEISLKQFKGLRHLIGNTPMLGINFIYKNKKRTIYAKAENFNLTGSIKDRMALYILQNAYETGKIKPGDTIAEATSGNTGISFSAVGRSLGHPVIIFMPDWMSRERVDLILSLGAKVNPVTKEQGGFKGSISMTEELAATTDNIFLPCQFSNEANIKAHFDTTGPEIWWQLSFSALKADAFVAGVGTGGTIMGVGRYLRSLNPAVKLHPIEPTESPTLRTGYKTGQHRIQGISDEFIPAIVNLKELDEVIDVHDGDAILMAQKLSQELGLALGISSGANFIGALKCQNMLGDDAVVVTIFPDDNKKYLSTDLLRTEPVKQNYLSPDVNLIDYKAFKRVCHICCDMDDCEQKFSTHLINEFNFKR